MRLKSSVKWPALILCLTTAITAYCQKINKKRLCNTYWFSENKDSMFFRHDTIKWIQYSNPAPDRDSGKYAESPLGYLGHGDYVSFKFNKKGRMQFWKTRYNYIGTIYHGIWSWNFNKKTNTIEIYYNKVLFYVFKPLSEKQVIVPSKYSVDTAILYSKELTMVRIINMHSSDFFIMDTFLISRYVLD